MQPTEIFISEIPGSLKIGSAFRTITSDFLYRRPSTHHGYQDPADCARKLKRFRAVYGSRDRSKNCPSWCNRPCRAHGLAGCSPGPLRRGWTPDAVQGEGRETGVDRRWDLAIPRPDGRRHYALPAGIVPVGEDRRSTSNLTRDIAQRFNSLYGDTFGARHQPSRWAARDGPRDPTQKMANPLTGAHMPCTARSAGKIRRPSCGPRTDSNPRRRYRDAGPEC